MLDGRLGLAWELVLVCKLALDDRQELVCVLVGVVGGMERVCGQGLVCELAVDDMEQVLVLDGMGLVLLHVLHRTHQQCNQCSDQLYTLRFDVFRRAVVPNNVH